MPSKLEQMGLVKYLDATKGLHYNNGYKEFEKLLAENAAREAIATKFGVSRRTVYNWLELYDKLLDKEKKQK